MCPTPEMFQRSSQAAGGQRQLLSSTFSIPPAAAHAQQEESRGGSLRKVEPLHPLQGFTCYSSPLGQDDRACDSPSDYDPSLSLIARMGTRTNPLYRTPMDQSVLAALPAVGSCTAEHLAFPALPISGLETHSHPSCSTVEPDSSTERCQALSVKSRAQPSPTTSAPAGPLQLEITCHSSPLGKDSDLLCDSPTDRSGSSLSLVARMGARFNPLYVTSVDRSSVEGLPSGRIDSAQLSFTTATPACSGLDFTGSGVCSPFALSDSDEKCQPSDLQPHSQHVSTCMTAETKPDNSEARLIYHSVWDVQPHSHKVSTCASTAKMMPDEGVRVSSLICQQCEEPTTTANLQQEACSADSQDVIGTDELEAILREAQQLAASLALPSDSGIPSGPGREDVGQDDFDLPADSPSRSHESDLTWFSADMPNSSPLDADAMAEASGQSDFETRMRKEASLLADCLALNNYDSPRSSEALCMVYADSAELLCGFDLVPIANGSAPLSASDIECPEALDFVEDEVTRSSEYFQLMMGEALQVATDIELLADCSALGVEWNKASIRQWHCRPYEITAVVSRCARALPGLMAA